MENNNKLDITAKYKVKISFDDYSSVNDILVSYYLPIIKSDAFSLYQALTLDARNNMINTLFVPVERIVSMINLSTEKIQSCIARLELVNLLEVYKEEDNRFIIKLNKPLSPEEFNNSEQFSELLKSSMGAENIIINNKLFNSMRELDINESKQTTSEVNISNRLETKEARLNVEYDFDSIKNILNAKGIDWSIYWSQELEEKLLNILVIYKISSFDVAIELIKEIESDSFSVKNLDKTIRDNFIKVDDINSIITAGENTTEIKLDYLSKLSVRDYFIHKLSRTPTPTEESLITKLINSYGLNNYQINILLDFSVIVNEGSVNKNYILKIADTILKEKLDTPEKLIQHLKVSYKLKTSGKTQVSGESLRLMDEIPIFD